MSPAYASRADYERYHVRVCARCERRAGISANWSDGPICRTCYTRALDIRGCCPGCGADRLLPGRDPAGQSICRDCARITRDFFCDRCCYEGRLHTGRLCSRCTLGDRLAVVLDDGTGAINPVLRPLAEALLSMPRPTNGIEWLRSPQVQELLTGLADGRIPLTHDALHDLPNWRTVAHLRDLLMATGTLAYIDKQVLAFETWLRARLKALAGGPHEQLLQQFGHWELLAGLRRRATTRTLPPAARRFASERFNAAQNFLAWLDTHHVALNTVTQADIDGWHARHPTHTRHALRAFLVWTMNTRHLPPVKIPPLQQTSRPPITEQQRIKLLRHVLDTETASPQARAAACLVLLYAQPVSRIARLTLDDLIDNGDELLLRLGEPPTPIPPPFAKLITDLIPQRRNMNTAANPNTRWLFPGQNAGQPLHPYTLSALLLTELDLPTTTARTAALRQLVLQTPAPVIAQALGFHHTTTTRAAAQAGSPWKTYAPGDHQTPPMTKPNDLRSDPQ